ncbi:MAG: NAD(P)H-binding protein, partial [Naasia sp.]
MSASLAVTGSSGALGGLVARGVTEFGVPSILVVRSADRAPQLPGTEVREASYADADASALALRGVKTLFMVSASESADRLVQHRNFVIAAAEAGVEHIVYTSFVGASPDCTFTLGRDHATTEESIRQTGMDFTILRDNFYLDFFQHLPGEDGAIRGPAGDGRVAGVARADVARVALEVLKDPVAHRGA